MPAAYRCPACRKRLRAGQLVLKGEFETLCCPSCGAEVLRRPPSKSPVVEKLRTWIARSDAAQQEPPTVGSRLRDALVFFLFGFNACLGPYLCLFAANVSAAGLIAVYSYRPIGWPREGLVAAVVVFGIVYALLTAPLFLLLMRRTPKSTLTVFVLLLLAAVPFIPLHIFVAQPWFARHLHLDNWPRDVPLIGFRVCASEFEHQEFRERLLASGTITIEIENRTPYVLDEAVYTVRTGGATGFWGHNTEYRFVIRDVPAGQRRRFETKAFLGAIVAMSGGSSPSSPVEATAEVRWDGVHFDQNVVPALAALPDVSTHLIDDCPGSQRPWLPWFRPRWRGPEDAIERMKKQRGSGPEPPR